jgi:hypothetical protein
MGFFASGATIKVPETPHSSFRLCFSVFQAPNTPPFHQTTLASALVVVYAVTAVTMINITAYPHILQSMMLHSDRATPAVIIRLCSYTRDLGIAVLYPGKLVDPLQLPSKLLFF